jgi:hypothetical protein
MLSTRPLAQHKCLLVLMHLHCSAVCTYGSSAAAHLDAYWQNKLLPWIEYSKVNLRGCQGQGLHMGGAVEWQHRLNPVGVDGT